MDTLEQICRKNLTQYAGSMARQAIECGDIHCSRWYGARVGDFVRQVEGRGYNASTPIYRRARTKLDRMAKKGEVVAYRPGPGAYVFYWPVGLAEKLRAE